jgi:outer membrane murein-binding lipoprotein Lpp
MKPPIAVALFVGATVVASGALAACPSHSTKTHTVKSHRLANNCVDLNAVPQITSQIVAGEPVASAAKSPAYEPLSTPSKYEGPTLGMTKTEPGVRPSPTVGYRWNLE